MQEKILIRSGDIAFAAAALFVLGIAAETFAWNIFALLILLLSVALAAIFGLHLSWRSWWMALVILLAIFVLAAEYRRIFVALKDPAPPPSPFTAASSAAASPQQNPIVGFAVAAFNAVLPTRSAELLGAMVSGSTAALDPELKAQMSASGTSYIVGMYGYKINLFAAAILEAGRHFFSRRVALVLVMMGVIAFVAIAGAPITAIRAGVMVAMVFFAKAIGRQFHARNIFTFTAAFMLASDPTLLTSAGFQLTFLSLIGIFVLGPPLKRAFRQTGHEFLEWKSHAIMSLAVNAAILPVVMLQFGDFSLTSFMSNFLIAIPFAVVMGLAVIIVAASSVAPYLAYGAGAIVNIFLSYQLWVIQTFAAVIFPIPPFMASESWIVLYYFALAAFIIHYEKTKKEIAAAL